MSIYDIVLSMEMYLFLMNYIYHLVKYIDSIDIYYKYNKNTLFNK